MHISYNKLWKLLIDKKISRADLRKTAGISPNTMTKIIHDEEVSLTILKKICIVLDVNIGDIVEFIKMPESTREEEGCLQIQQPIKEFMQCINIGVKNLLMKFLNSLKNTVCLEIPLWIVSAAQALLSLKL